MAASCSTDPQASPENSREGMAQVNFSLRAPGMSRGETTRDFPVGFEDNISDITLFLAHKNGTEFIMDSMIIVEEFFPVSATTQAFTVDLPVSSVPTKIFAVGNLRNSVAGSWESVYYTNADFDTMGKGETESDFVRYLNDSWADVSTDYSGIGSAAMYMAGSAVLPTIERGDVNLHISLLRWVARADVKLDLGADSRPFEPTEVTLWHGYSSASVLPGAAAYDPDNAARVLSPTLVGAARLGNDLGIPVTTLGTTGVIATTYVGEHDAQTTTDGKVAAPCLILGGHFDGSSTVSYYRIDFDPQIDGHPFGQVLRNWHYIFNVTKIMSAGYPSAQEAADNPAHSIVLEIEMWEDNVQQINFTGTDDYMYVNTLEVLTNYHQSALGTFEVRSTLPFEWGFDTTNMVACTSDDPITDANFSVAITERQVNADYTDYTFTVSTLADNTTNVRNEAGIFIKANGALMSLELTQRGEAVTDRVIRVLSLTGNIGSFGTYYVNSNSNVDGANNNMRNILLNKQWFGPTGVVKCGGFSFERFQTDEMSATYKVSLDKLQRALDATDILVTCYTNNPSQEVTDMILKWNQRPYHVLFVVADAGLTTTTYGTPTNVILRQSLHDSQFFNNGLSWYRVPDLTTDFNPTNTQTITTPNDKLTAALGTDYLTDIYVGNGGELVDGEPIHAATHSIVMADQTNENLVFMAGTGAFGPPDQNMMSIPSSYKLWDDISEWAVPTTTSPVLPLMVIKANIWGYNSNEARALKTNAMMVGVDMEHTTVYLGESQQIAEYLVVAPPSGAGLINSPYYNSLTMLMSNIWAWAVKNVLAQVKED